MATETNTPKSRKGIGGPKTKEGKDKIRLNALKLGLYAQSLEGMQAVADLVGVQFEEIHQKMIDYHRPQDPLEETLVRRIARCTWKLMLVETMEDHLLRGLEVRHAPGRSLEGISVIERRTDVQLHRAIAALACKRRQEQENVKNELNEAIGPRARFAPPADQQPVSPPVPVNDGSEPNTQDSQPTVPDDSLQTFTIYSPVGPPTSSRQTAPPRPESPARRDPNA